MCYAVGTASRVLIDPTQQRCRRAHYSRVTRVGLPVLEHSGARSVADSAKLPLTLIRYVCILVLCNCRSSRGCRVNSLLYNPRRFSCSGPQFASNIETVLQPPLRSIHCKGTLNLLFCRTIPFVIHDSELPPPGTSR